MLNWIEVDPHAIEPRERYRAVLGDRSFRIFYRPGDAQPWILSVIDNEDDRLLMNHLCLDGYVNLEAAQDGAESWVAID